MKTILAAATLLIASTSLAAEPPMRQHFKDESYGEAGHKDQTFEVWTPDVNYGSKGYPVIIWIHGGGWRQGDKSAVQEKPQAFVDNNYVFISINYRLVPQVTIKEMARDVAKAIRRAYGVAGNYGGDSQNIFVMGHSAGAHLAALVCTDERYLKAEGMKLSMIKGCIPVDTAAYDIAGRFANADSGPKAKKGASVFGSDPAVHKDLSPITHVAKGKSIPPFLILHVADRAESKTQSQQFAKALEAAGVSATVVAAEGKTHGTINSDLGKPDDKPTKAVFEFLKKHSK